MRVEYFASLTIKYFGSTSPDLTYLQPARIAAAAQAV